MHAAPSHPHSRRILPLAVGVLVLMAILPARLTAWTGWFKPLVLVPVAPISGASAWIAQRVLPASPVAMDEEVSQLKDQASAFNTLYLREKKETERLRQLIQELQHGLALNPDLPVKQKVAPVIGSSAELSSGLLTIKAGKAAGVDTNTVAATAGLQLVGRVVSVSGPLCQVRPITRKGGTRIGVRVMTGSDAEGLLASLAAVGDGTLRGEVQYYQPVGATAPVEPEVGQLVRLDDSEWPKSARMLIVGRVKSVEPSEERPQGKVIVVEPGLRLERVSEVVLRITESEPEEKGETP